jgi:hypothetical protein
VNTRARKASGDWGRLLHGADLAAAGVEDRVLVAQLHELELLLDHQHLLGEQRPRRRDTVLAHETSSDDWIPPA